MTTTYSALASQARAAGTHVSAAFAVPAGHNRFQVTADLDGASLTNPNNSLTTQLESSADGVLWRFEASRTWRGGPGIGPTWIRVQDPTELAGRQLRAVLIVHSGTPTVGARIICDAVAIATRQSPQTPKSYAYQQSRSSDAGSGASMSLAYTSNNQANSLLVLGTSTFSPTTDVAITSISDTAGNAWNINTQTANLLLGFNSQVHYVANSIAGANTVTVNDNDSPTAIAMALFEYQGGDLSAPLAGQNSGTGTSAAPSSGSATSASPGSLFWGWIVANFGEAFTVESGWTDRENGGSNPNITFDAEELISSGTYTATWALSTSTQWGAILLAFRPGRITYNAAVNTATWTARVPTFTAALKQSPAVNTATWNAPAPVFTAAFNYVPAVNTATWNAPAPTFTTGGGSGITFNAPVNTATWNAPAPAFSGSLTQSPAVNTAAWSTPAAGFTAASNFAPAVNTAAWSTPAAGFTAASNFAPAVNTASWGAPTPTFISGGGFEAGNKLVFTAVDPGRHFRAVDPGRHVKAADPGRHFRGKKP